MRTFVNAIEAKYKKWHPKLRKYSLGGTEEVVEIVDRLSKTLLQSYLGRPSKSLLGQRDIRPPPFGVVLDGRLENDL